MSVAVPVAVVVEEPPVNLPLAKNSLNLAHLPSDLLQNDADHLDPISITQQLGICDATGRFYKGFDYLLHKLLKVFSDLQFCVGGLLKISNCDIVSELFAFIVLLKEPLILLEEHLEVSQQLHQAILVESLPLLEGLIEHAFFDCNYVQEDDLERTNKVGANPSISFCLEHAAIFPEQLQLVFQIQVGDAVWKLIEADRQVGRWLFELLLQDFVDEIGHEYFPFGCVEEVAPSQSFILHNESLKVVPASFVSDELVA